MKPQLPPIESENLQKDHITFQDILSDDELSLFSTGKPDNKQQ